MMNEMVCSGKGWGWVLGLGACFGELLGSLGRFFEVLEVVSWFCCAGAVLCASFQKTRGVVSAVVHVEKSSLVEFSSCCGLFYKGF